MLACLYFIRKEIKLNMKVWDIPTPFISTSFLLSFFLSHIDVQTHRCTYTHIQRPIKTHSINPWCRPTLTQWSHHGSESVWVQFTSSEALEISHILNLFFRLSGLCKLMIRVAAPDKSSFSPLRNNSFHLCNVEWKIWRVNINQEWYQHWHFFMRGYVCSWLNNFRNSDSQTSVRPSWFFLCI